MVTALGIQEICSELHLGLSFDDVLSYVSLVDTRQRLELSYAQVEQLMYAVIHSDTRTPYKMLFYSFDTRQVGYLDKQNLADLLAAIGV